MKIFSKGFTLIRLLLLRKRSCKGFTLIELLVVISIISILSAVGVVSYRGVTAKARDNQRIRDLQAIKQALELYRSDVHNYPPKNSFVLNTATALTNCTGVSGCATPSVTYLQQVPRDPDSTNRKYYYVPTTTSDTTDCNNTTADKACLIYYLCARKEGSEISYDSDSCRVLSTGGSCGGISGEHCNIGVSSQ